MGKKLKIVGRVTRKGPSATDAESLKDMRRKITKEFPPARVNRARRTQLAMDIAAARKAQGLTWYAIAKRAGIPNPNTVRDIELGRDVLVSNLQSVAKVLNLNLVFATGIKIKVPLRARRPSRRGSSTR